MQIVIDIDPEYIKQIDRIRFLIGGKEDRILQFNVINAIKIGTQLPKGHGRLIDADALELDADWNDYCDGYIAYSASMINNAPTIIEADKEEEE